MIQQWADNACLDNDKVIVSVQVVSNDEMRELNRTWRGKDRPTNVLSFPMELPDEVDLKILGDLVLCADVINTEAEQQHKPVKAHWAHMVVHGMLHLLSRRQGAASGRTSTAMIYEHCKRQTFTV